MTEDLALSRNAIPSHVPQELIGDFDIFGDPEMEKCPFSVVSRLHDGPRVVWSPHVVRDLEGGEGGAWVLTREEDIRAVLLNTQMFSSRGVTGFSSLLGEDWDMVPLEIDPPNHTAFRTLFNPHLSPRIVSEMAAGILERADGLIDEIADNNGCEFMASFGTPLPISIFMQLMGLAASETPTFLIWETDLLHSPDEKRRRAAARSIKLYLMDLAAQRQAEPKSDFASVVANGEIDGRKLTDDEVIGTLYTFFVAGLDTVASTLGWFFYHLAIHPEQQQWLRDNPSKIRRSVDELLRRYSLPTSRRRCLEDVEIAGVQMKKGDWISLTHAAGSLDPAVHENPMTVDFSRKGGRHLGFAVGPHFCIGSHLAKRELEISLERWLARIPQWRLKDGSTPLVHGTTVFGVDKLELQW